jgi:WD40 repeat protein
MPSDFFPKYIEDRVAGFAARQWVLDKVVDWLGDSTQPRVLLVTGEPGCGKTALSAWLAVPSDALPAGPLKEVRSTLTAKHFCMAEERRGSVQPTRFAQSLAQQICERIPEFGPLVLEFVAPTVRGEPQVQQNWGMVIGTQIQNLLITSPDPEEVYDRSIRQPLERLYERQPGTRIFILVDALDEALSPGGRCTIVDLLAGSEDFPPNVRFLLTSRLEPRVLVKFPHARALNLSDPCFSAAVNDDIHVYIKQRLVPGLSAATIEALVTAADGNFLYVRTLLDEVAHGTRKIDDFATLPSGLHALYRSSLDRLTGADADVWAQRFQPLLGRLSVAASAVGQELLGEWTDQHAQIAANLERVYQFVEASGDAPSYRLYHRSMADFLALDTYRANRLVLPNPYHTPRLLQHKSIADFYLGRYDERWSDCDAYGLRHLLWHLSEAGRSENLQHVLLTFSWLQAKLRAVDVNAVIADFDYFPDEPDLQIVQGALRLSAHILAEDPKELPGQLVSRLPEKVAQKIDSLRSQAAAWRQFPWLCPVTPNLTPAGGPLERSLVGHEGEVRRVEILPDERRIISMASDGPLRIWDTKTATELHTLRGSKGAIRSMVLAADGCRVICGLASAWQLQMWDMEHGTELPTPRGATDPVVFTSDARCAISGFVDLEGMMRDGSSSSDANTLKVWDLATATVRFDLPGARFPLVLLSNSNRAVSASLGTAVRIWDLTTGEEQPPLKAQGWVRQIYVTPDERIAILVAARPDAVTIWDLGSRTAQHRLIVHPLSVSHGTVMAVTPHGRRAVFSSNDNNLVVWNLDGPEERYRLPGHTSWLKEIFVTPSGHRAVSLSADSIRLWDLESGNELRALTQESTLVACVTLPGRSRVVFSTHGELKLWNVENGDEVQTRQLQTDVYHHRFPNAVAVTPDAHFIIFGLEDGTLRVWDLAKNDDELFVMAGHAAAVTTMMALPDGHRVISGSKDRTLKVWDLSRLAKPPKPKGHPHIITAIAFTRDGQRVVSVSDYPTVTFTSSLKVWDHENGDEVLTLSAHNWQVDALAVLPDGHRVVLAPSENEIVLWDLERGVEVGRLYGHSGAYVARVAATPDGRRAVSVEFDNTGFAPEKGRGTVCVWDIERATLMHTFPEHYDRAAITPNGQKVVIVRYGWDIEVWDLCQRTKLGSFYHGRVEAVAVMADSQHIVSATGHEEFRGWDTELRVWDIESGESCLTLRTHRWDPKIRQIQLVATTPDGKSLIAPSPSEAYLLKIWNLDRKGESRDLGKHGAAITAVAVAKDGSRAVSASEDNSLKVWDLECTKCISTFTTEHPLQCCAIDPEGLTVAAGDISGRVHILSVAV